MMYEIIWNIYIYTKDYRGFVSHHVDIFQIDSFICILLYNQIKEKVIFGG